MPNLGFQELLVIFLIIALLFGAKKIPELARGLGQAMREFKKAMKEGEQKKEDSDRAGENISSMHTKDVKAKEGGDIK